MKRAPRRRQKPAPSAPSAPRQPASERQLQRLLHELQVHSEQLTVQNEQLLKARTDIEQARDRYAELYDLAPLGYLLLDLRGHIRECNIAAASLLGRSRHLLESVPLSSLIEADQRAVLANFVDRAASAGDRRAVRVELKTRPPNERILRLFARAHERNGARLLFTALMDVTTERQLEHERRGALERELSRSRELAGEVSERSRAEIRVKTLLDRLVSVQEDERRRLSRDLHDHLGQQLTALRLALNVLKDRSGGEVRRELERIEGLAGSLDHDVDHLAWELRPPALDEFGLAPALDSLIREWTQYNGVAATFASPHAPARMPRDVENNLYRIVQESLHNVAKHAAATRVSVRLEHVGASVHLTIEDNGRGFDPVQGAAGLGLGLVGMHERTALIGGEILIDSAPGRGTVVTVHVTVPGDPS